MNFSAIRTTNSKRAPTVNEEMSGWGGDQGLKAQIKAKHVGAFTTRRDSVTMTGDAEKQAMARINMLKETDQYGSGFRAKNQTRGIPQFRSIDYAGNGSSGSNSTAGVGQPLGKVPNISNVNVTTGILRESIRGESEAVSHRGVHNIGEGSTTAMRVNYATPEQSRPVQGAETAAYKDSILNTFVTATSTYYSNESTQPFNMNLTSNINKLNTSLSTGSGISTRTKFDPVNSKPVTELTDRIHTDAGAGISTRTKFDPVNSKPVTELIERIQISAKSGEKLIPKYETIHLIPSLESKLTADNVISSKNNTRNNVTIKSENKRIQKQTAPLTSFQPQKMIGRNLSSYKQNFKIKPKISLGDFSANAGSNLKV